VKQQVKFALRLLTQVPLRMKLNVIKFSRFDQKVLYAMTSIQLNRLQCKINSAHISKTSNNLHLLYKSAALPTATKHAHALLAISIKSHLGLSECVDNPA
jgi:polyisoprenoid-binding protein YceI